MICPRCRICRLCRVPMGTGRAEIIRGELGVPRRESESGVVECREDTEVRGAHPPKSRRYRTFVTGATSRMFTTCAGHLTHGTW